MGGIGESTIAARICFRWRTKTTAASKNSSNGIASKATTARWNIGCSHSYARQKLAASFSSEKQIPSQQCYATPNEPFFHCTVSVLPGPWIAFFAAFSALYATNLEPYTVTSAELNSINAIHFGSAFTKYRAHVAAPLASVSISGLLSSQTFEPVSIVAASDGSRTSPRHASGLNTASNALSSSGDRPRSPLSVFLEPLPGGLPRRATLSLMIAADCVVSGLIEAPLAGELLLSVAVEPVDSILRKSKSNATRHLLFCEWPEQTF